MYKYYVENKVFLNKLILSLLFVFFTYIFFSYIFNYVAPFILGAFISIIINPLVTLVSKHLNIGRGIASILIIILVFIIFGFTISFIVIRIIEESKIFHENINIYLNDLIAIIKKARLNIQNFLYFSKFGIDIEIERFIQDLVLSVSSSIFSIKVFKSVPQIFIFIIFTFISSFMFCKDIIIIKNSVNKFMNNIGFYRFSKFKKNIFIAITTYIRAQIIIMFFIATTSIIGLSIIGSRFAILIGVVIAILDALPILGSGFILWPWIAYSVFYSDIKTAIGLSILYCVLTLVNQSLQPKLIGKGLGIHPLLILISLYVCIKIFGIFGILIGPITTIIIKTITSEDSLK